MTYPRLRAALLVATLLSLVASPASAWILKCEYPPPEELFQRADVIFVGTVVGDALERHWPVKDRGSHRFKEEYAACVQVDEALKGTTHGSYLTVLSQHPYFDGADFEIGTEQLFVAVRKKNGRLATDPCLPSVPHDLGQLRQIAATAPPTETLAGRDSCEQLKQSVFYPWAVRSPPPQSGRGCAGCATPAESPPRTLGALLLIPVLVFFLHHRRRRLRRPSGAREATTRPCGLERSGPTTRAR